MKKRIRTKSVKYTFMFYMAACMAASLGLSLLFSNLCQAGTSKIYDRYLYVIQNAGYMKEFSFHGQEIGGEVRLYLEDLGAYFTPAEQAVYHILDFLSIAVYPVSFFACIGITGVLFYKRQLQKPFAVLADAVQHITANDLDFEISYDRQNELGTLCASMEKMRAALLENNLEMWRQMEERKRLNSAFAHDLRTPLTVLKGQSEMLAKYGAGMQPEKTEAAAQRMCRHILRLEAYVEAMASLQRLEDLEINREPVPVQEAAGQLREAGSVLCRDQRFIFSADTTGADEICLDPAAVMRVYENLLSNAVRFAREHIEVRVKIQENEFSIAVADDGNGFTKKDLAQAAGPFYHSDSGKDPQHFGIGLYICRVICEKHGGYLKLENEKGALVTAVFAQKEKSITKDQLCERTGII